MQAFTFGDWDIRVDVETTRDYYTHFNDALANPPHMEALESYSQTLSAIAKREQEGTRQLYRNYKQFCQALLPEERAFFDRLGIDPALVCRFGSPGRHEDHTVWCLGNYPAVGSIAETPKWVEAIQSGDIPEGEQLYCTDIQIGRFHISPLTAQDSLCPFLPQDQPEKFIVLRFSVIIPWMLDEPCLKPAPHCARWWEIGQKIHEQHARALVAKERAAALKAMTLHALGGGPVISLNRKQIQSVRREWFACCMPPEQRKQAGKQNLKWLSNAFLWSVHIRELAGCLEGNAAAAAFDAVDKTGATFLPGDGPFQYPLALQAESTIRLTAADLNGFGEIMVVGRNLEYAYIRMQDGIGDVSMHFYRRP